MPELSEALVLRVSAAGEGERACVDLTTTLAAHEGLLVGSFSRAFFLACAEVEETSYAPARPFRVNAGAVHQYMLLPDNKTAYLTELRSGSRVLVCNGAGTTRTETVGRVKLERRSLLLLEAQTEDGEMHTVLMQDAPTARLMTPAGPRAACDLVPGARILLRRCADTARHAGVPVETACIER